MPKELSVDELLRITALTTFEERLTALRQIINCALDDLERDARTFRSRLFSVGDARNSSQEKAHE